jgi:3D (Asp-Asp-Asp) domain-containing protein
MLTTIASCLFAAAGSYAGWHPVSVEATAYCTCTICCGPRACGITASGQPARGKLVAAPAKYRFGTEMIVPGYGRVPVLDRGGAIKAAGQFGDGKWLKHDRIDVLMPTHKQARQWGRKSLTVWVKD